MGTLRLFLLGAAVALMTVLAVACGGDDDYGDDDTGNAGGAPGTPTARVDNSGAIIKVADAGQLGAILTDGAGMTLYIFTKDTPNKSTCNDTCAATWPPLEATASRLPVVDGLSGELSLITRDDGSKQVALAGRPLYRYAADKAPGETKGEGVGGVWFVAKAAGNSSPAPAATQASISPNQDPYGY